MVVEGLGADSATLGGRASSLPTEAPAGTFGLAQLGHQDSHLLCRLFMHHRARSRIREIMKTILIVDDSKAMRLILRRTLRQAGFTELSVVEACNGKEALDLILQSEPDFVLSDWNMPEMTGLELLNELRSRKNRVRFGFVTTEGGEEMRATASAAGALFLIAKPFGPEQFGAVLAPFLS